jgi:PAS domain S-box-containing protein
VAHSRQAYTTVELILNSMQEGLMALDADGQSLLSNDTASRMFPADLTGVPVEQWATRLGLFQTSGRPCAPEDLPHVRALHGAAGSGVDLLVRTAQLPAGRTLRCSFRPILNPQGIAGALVVFSDITDLQRLQGEQALGVQQLRETQRRLVDALHIGRIGNWEFDIATGSLWWSDEVYALFGYELHEFLPRHDHVMARMHPDDRARYTQVRAASLEAGTPMDIEYRLVMPGGRVRWLHQIGQTHHNDTGVAVRRAGVVQDITERKQADAELVLLHNAVSRINDIVLIAEAATRERPSMPIVFVNDAFERLTGYTAAETLGHEPMILQGVGTDAQTAERIEQALTVRTALREEVQIYSKGGLPIWIELDLVPLVDDRKAAERALIESEQRYQALFDQGPLPMWVFDTETSRFLAVNQAASQLYGYSREEFHSLTLDAIRPESERERLRNRLARGFTGKTEQWLHCNRYGAEFPVEVVSNPISYAGRPARFVVAHDISTRVKAERELQEHLFTLQRAADAAQALVEHQTLQGVLNELVEQGRGVVRAHQAIVTLKSGDGWASTVSAVSLSEKYAAYRDYIEDPDGTGIYAVVCETNRPLRLTQAALEAHPRWRGFGAHADQHPPMRGWLAVPLIGAGGANIGVLQLTDKYEGEFTAQDEYVALELAQLASIAIGNAQLLEQVRELNAGLERKVSERTTQLAREEARYRALAEEAPQVVWNYEPGRGVTYFNRAWYDLVGGTARDWLGEEPWQAAVHPEDRDAVLENWRRAQATLTPFVGIRRLLARDGTYRITSYRGVPVLDERQNVLAWVGIDADVTDIKAIEEALRQSNQELEAFSYSVSHDLRSPLNSIDGFSRLLARQMEGKINEQGAHYLARIQAGVSHMGQLIEGLLSLAQISRANLRTETVDVSTLAREAIERNQQREPERQVTVHVEDGLTLPGDTRLFRVVLDNLIGNAWKFTSRRPDATITVGSTGAPWTFFVHDNGAGFDMAYADKLFGVFQRLHSARDFPGTGVGLATVQRIIVRHHGRIWAQSEPGVGTTFYFTVAENTAAAASESVPADAGPA